jgi:hypothetical protein
MFYWEKAYMADWILNAAIEKDITYIEIDILQKKVEPKELEIRPITGHLGRLLETIEATLHSNKFPTDFIVEAKFKINIPESSKATRFFSCKATVTDKDGRVYEGRNYTERAYENPFRVFSTSFTDRLRGLMKWTNNAVKGKG